jgi:hypothetical protein
MNNAYCCVSFALQLVYGKDINPFRPGQWLAVYDATGAACVVQFKDGIVEVLDNKLGVLVNMYFPTNDGYLKEQTQVSCRCCCCCQGCGAKCHGGTVSLDKPATDHR